eukprot:366243-Chlamydomonas_euryale.AAC.6
MPQGCLSTPWNMTRCTTYTASAAFATTCSSVARDHTLKHWLPVSAEIDALKCRLFTLLGVFMPRSLTTWHGCLNAEFAITRVLQNSCRLLGGSTFVVGAKRFGSIALSWPTSACREREREDASSREMERAWTRRG